MGKSKHFKSKEEFVQVMTALFEKLKYDPQIGPDVKKSNLIIRFDYHDPDASVTIDAKNAPADPKAFVEYAWDAKTPEPEVVMSNSGDFCLGFWQGKENPVLAMTFGKLKAKGNITKAMALLPAIKPAYKAFPKILRDMGKGNMVL